MKFKEVMSLIDKTGEYDYYIAICPESEDDTWVYTKTSSPLIDAFNEFELSDIGAEVIENEVRFQLWVNINHATSNNEQKREIKVNATYRHFKGKLYVVDSVARFVDDDDMLVIYHSVESYKIYARRMTEFLSEVDKLKYPNAKQNYRFEEIE